MRPPEGSLVDWLIQPPFRKGVSMTTDQRGQSLAEYALILALIAVVAIAALLFLGGQITAILSAIGAAL